MAFSGCLGQCASRTNFSQWNVPGRYWPYGELSLFSFLVEESNGPQGAGSAGAQHPAAWLLVDSAQAGICARQ